MAADFYGASGVFIVQTFPVGTGSIKTDVSYSDRDARAVVAAQLQAGTYTVTTRGEDHTFEAASCCIWEIQANNGGQGPLVTGYRKVGDWAFDGLGGVRRLETGGNTFAPGRETAERAMAGRAAAAAPAPPDVELA